MATNPNLRVGVQNEDREFNLWHGLNLITATSDPRIPSSNLTFSTQNTRFMVAPVIRGDVISNLGVFATVAGTAVTLFKLAVWNNNGVLLGSTGDLSGSLGANAWVSGALTTPVSLAYSGIVYLGATCVFTTTSPTLVSTNVAQANESALPSGPQFMGINGSTADVPAALTFGAGTLSSLGIHVVAY